MALFIMKGGVRYGVVVVKKRTSKSEEHNKVDDVASVHNPGVAPKMYALSVHNERLVGRMGLRIKTGNTEGVIRQWSVRSGSKVGGSAQQMIHDEDKGVELGPCKSDNGKIEHRDVDCRETGTSRQTGGRKKIDGG